MTSPHPMDSKFKAEFFFFYKGLFLKASSHFAAVFYSNWAKLFLLVLCVSVHAKQCTDAGVGGGDELRNDALAASSRIAYAALQGGFLRALKGPHLKRVNHGDTLLTAREQKERELEDVAFCVPVGRQCRRAWKAQGRQPRSVFAARLQDRPFINECRNLNRLKGEGVQNKKLDGLCKASGGWFKVVNKVHLPLEPVQKG